MEEGGNNLPYKWMLSQFTIIASILPGNSKSWNITICSKFKNPLATELSDYMEKLIF